MVETATRAARVAENGPRLGCCCLPAMDPPSLAIMMATAIRLHRP